MNYEEALDYIHGTLRFGSKLGLENIRNLLERMGNPHKKLKFVHVAGTNGKGSTTAMITEILKEAGYKTGMYTSPFIEEFTERIQVNGEKIDKGRLANIAGEIKRLIDQIVADGLNHPTEFEIVTALAFQYFYEQNCDVVVLEVGLGGRFDATNVIDPPMVSVITSISMDHMEYLGDTLEKIAFEKCGIIKENGTVVVYPEQQPEVLEVVRSTAKDKKAEVRVASLENIRIVSDTLHGMIFNLGSYEEFKTTLLGEHQVKNAATALSVIETIAEKYGYKVSEGNIRNGLQKVKWPGRFEILSNDPLVIIDGAHNQAGIYTLKKCFEKYADGKKLTMVMGMLRDKEYENCVAEIAPLADHFIATEPLSPRTLPADELAKVAEKFNKNVSTESNIIKALELAKTITPKDGMICCFGSLYMIGTVRTALK